MLRFSGPGQVLGSYVASRVLVIRLVQWLGWVFESKERKKERKLRISRIVVSHQTKLELSSDGKNFQLKKKPTGTNAFFPTFSHSPRKLEWKKPSNGFFPTFSHSPRKLEWKKPLEKFGPLRCHQTCHQKTWHVTAENRFNFDRVMLTNDEGGPRWGGGGILHHFEFKTFYREFEWYVMNSVFSWKGTIESVFMVLPFPGYWSVDQ